MMMQFKILVLVLILHIVDSKDKDLEIDSTTSHESCIDSDETKYESNCFCYNEPEKEFEYSVCALIIEATTTSTTPTTTHKPCPVLNMPDRCYQKDRYRLVQGGICFYFERKYMNWEDARDNCKQKGGKLYEPKDVAEMKHMALVAWGVCNFGYSFTWLGITDTAMEGTFVYKHHFQSSLARLYQKYIPMLGLLLSNYYRVYHIEMDETKWLLRVEESIILLNYGA